MARMVLTDAIGEAIFTMADAMTKEDRMAMYICTEDAKWSIHHGIQDGIAYLVVFTYDPRGFVDNTFTAPYDPRT